MAETVAGLLGLMALLVGGLGVLFKRWMDQREELRSVRTALDRDYLLREPHMQEHGLIKDRLSRHDSRLNALEARVDRWERKA